MSLQEAASAAGVNPHNGASIDSVQADRFQGLWEGGAFAQTGPTGEELPGERAPPRQEARQAPQQAYTPREGEPAKQEVPRPDPNQAQPEVAEPVVAAEEGPEYADLNDYLTKSQIDPESFMQMPVSVKVDGKTGLVSMADLVRSYQTDSHVTQKSQAIAEQQRAFEAERTRITQGLQQNLQTVTSLVTLAHQELLRDYQGIDWNRLQAEDPIRWSVLDRQFQNRNAAIQQAMQQTALQYQQQQQTQTQELAQRLPQEREKMIERIPQWRDAKQFDADRAVMAQSAQEMGFTPAEISQIHDHRYMVALHFASQFLKLQAKTPQALKKVRAAPQMANPGARITRDPNQVARTQAKANFMKHRRDPDAQAAYFETLAT
jgi:hypothetical protein